MRRGDRRHLGGHRRIAVVARERLGARRGGRGEAQGDDEGEDALQRRLTLTSSTAASRRLAVPRSPPPIATCTVCPANWSRVIVALVPPPAPATPPPPTL